MAQLLSKVINVYQCVMMYDVFFYMFVLCCTQVCPLEFLHRGCTKSFPVKQELQRMAEAKCKEASLEQITKGWS